MSQKGKLPPRQYSHEIQQPGESDAAFNEGIFHDVRSVMGDEFEFVEGTILPTEKDMERAADVARRDLLDEERAAGEDVQMIAEELQINPHDPNLNAALSEAQRTHSEIVADISRHHRLQR